jgi:hypothetical protein
VYTNYEITSSDPTTKNKELSGLDKINNFADLPLPRALEPLL